MERGLNWSWVLVVAVVAALVFPEAVFASNADTIPELSSGVEKVANTMSGPVLRAVALIGIIGGGLMLLFGGDLGQFAKFLAQAALILGLLSSAAGMLGSVFGIRGADVGGLEQPRLREGAAGRGEGATWRYE